MAIAPAGIGVDRAIVIPFAAPDNAVPARDLIGDAVAGHLLGPRSGARESTLRARLEEQAAPIALQLLANAAPRSRATGTIAKVLD
jgi:hypothetical protein